MLEENHLFNQKFCSQFMKRGFLFSTKDLVYLGFGEAAFFEKSPNIKVYAPDFFLKKKNAIWDFSSVTQVGVKELFSLIDALMHFYSFSSELLEPLGLFESTLAWNSPCFLDFKEKLKDLKKKIKGGVLQKAVPVFFQKAHKKVTSLEKGRWLLSLLKQFLAFSSQSYPLQVYGVWNEEEGILGLTPETFFELDATGHFYTMALAGTALKPKGLSSRLLSSLKESFFADPKQQAEHQFVINGITESLASFGTQESGKTEILELPSLFHLKTLIQMRFPSYFPHKVDWAALLLALHPTPALGGFPKQAAWEWLQETESQRAERGRFGAPFGVFHPDGSAAFCVAIRNLQWEGETIFLGAGCGIIAESQLYQEWEELLGKIKSVKNYFK